MFDDLPDIALSIMQPWAWLIANRHKAIENRDWSTRFRGTIAIHAGKKMDEGPWRDLLRGYHPVTYKSQKFWPGIDVPTFERGGIVGVADIVDCVKHSGSAWFVGRYGFVLANQRPVPFIPVKGALGFFKWKERML